ncbi:MAG: hypothetical protein Q9157_001746 [Trypethelium eluteriae]
MAELGIAASIVQIVSLGTKLSFSFYRLASSVSNATNDVNRVAKGVNLFCLMLKQVGATLRDDDTQEPIHSAEALETVQEIIQQCSSVFGELRSMLEHCGWAEDHMELSRIQKVRWTVKRPKVEYVLGHLDSLKLTLAVMMQTLQAARVLAISRRMSATSAASTGSDDDETITNEKAHLEGLVVEQQLSLFKASELYGEYQATETEETTDEKAVVPARERVASIVTEMKPAGLELYQEKSLEQVYTSSVESDRVAAVLKIASPFADNLLKQWTLLDRSQTHDEIRGNLAVRSPQGKLQPSLRRIASQPERPESAKPRKPYLTPRPPFYQNPSVESDSEDDTLSSKFSTQSTLHELDSEASPFARAPNSFNPMTQSFPSGTKEYLPNTSVARGSTSPISPIEKHNSATQFPKPGLQHRPGPHRIFSANDADPLYHNSAYSGEREGLGIPWRIRLRGCYWDFLDGKLNNTNMPNPGKETFNDPQVRTEVSSSWVCREAIEARGLDYNSFRVNGQKGPDSDSVYYSIHCPLDLPHVKEMVVQTAQIYRQRRASSSQPASPQVVQPTWQSSQLGGHRPSNSHLSAPPVRSPDVASAPGPQLFRYGGSTRSMSQSFSPSSAQPSQPRIHVDRPSSSSKSARNFDYDDDDDDYDNYDENRRKERSKNRKSDRSKSRSVEKEKKGNSITSGSAAKNAGKLGTIFGLAALLDGLGDI